MNALVSRDTIFVKERIGFFKAANAYDLLDPATGKPIGVVQEHVPNRVVKVFKFTKYKTLMPFSIDMMDEAEHKLLSLKRGLTFFRSDVSVFDQDGQRLGHFHQRLFSLGGKFEVRDSHGRQVAMLRGDWKGWNFTFVDNQGNKLGIVTKKWAGLGKELFTSADNYIIDIDPSVKDEGLRGLVLAAAICVDMVLKERGR